MNTQLLGSGVSSKEVISYCRNARDEGAPEVVIAPFYVPLARRILNGSATRITVYVGYPLGTDSARTKAYAARDAVRMGARRVIIVPNLAMIKEHNYTFVKKEAELVKNETGNLPLALSLPSEVGEEERRNVLSLISPLGISVLRETGSYEVTTTTSNEQNLPITYGGDRSEGNKKGHQAVKANGKKNNGAWMTFKKVIWIIFFGIGSWIELTIMSILCFVVLIYIPVGIQLWKMRKLVFNPYGKGVLMTNSGGKMFFNVIWLLIGGWSHALSYCLLGIACFISIIFIPQGSQFFKLAKFVLMPIGATIVSEDDPRLQR